MSNNCGQMPVYIPTYVNLKVRNLDVVDVAATSVSCTNLTVQGNPISDVFQNVIATPNVTQFVGGVVTDDLSANNSVQTDTVISEHITTQTLDVASSLNAASTTVTSLSAANISCPSAAFADCQSSDLTVLSTLTTGTINQTSGVAYLRSINLDGTLIFKPTYSVVWDATQVALGTTATQIMSTSVTSGTWRIDCSALYQIDSAPNANTLQVAILAGSTQQFNMQEIIPVSTNVTGTIRGGFIYTTTSTQTITATMRMMNAGTTASALSSTSSTKNSFLSVVRIA